MEPAADAVSIIDRLDAIRDDFQHAFHEHLAGGAPPSFAACAQGFLASLDNCLVSAHQYRRTVQLHHLTAKPDAQPSLEPSQGTV